MKPEELFRYADKFARRNEDKGRGTVCPTMRQAAKRFRCTYDDIQDACDAWQGDGYLGIAVAVGISGVGMADIEPRGEQLIEAYR